MTAANGNGEAVWPEDLHLEMVEIKVPAEGLPDRERTYAYQTAILRVAAVLPKMVQALNFLRDAGHQVALEAIGARNEAASAHAASTRVEEMLRNMAKLPPMRPESPSSHDLLERLDDRVTASFVKKASETPGPMLTGTPPDLAAIAKSAAAELLLEERKRITDAANAQRLAELEAADKKRTADLDAAAALRASDKHKLTQKLIGTAAAFILIAIIGAIGTVMWTGAKVVAARELGHSEGVREMQVAPPPTSAAAAPR
jgi:hypothetical protein